MRWGWFGFGISSVGLFILIIISMNVNTLNSSWQYLGITTDIVAVVTAIGIIMAILGHKNWKNR